MHTVPEMILMIAVLLFTLYNKMLEQMLFDSCDPL